MSGMSPEPRISRIRLALESGRMQQVERGLAALNPAEIASLLCALPPRQRRLLWDLVRSEDDGEVLLHLPEDVRDDLIGEMDDAELVAAAEELDIDDLADFIEYLPETVTQQVMRALAADDRARLEAVMGHDPDTAGGLMDPDTVAVRPDVSLETVQRYLRMRGELPQHTDALFVTDRFGRYLGRLSLAHILTGHPETTVAQCMDHSQPALPVDMAAHDVAVRFQNSDWLSAPVVSSEHQRLIGRITVDDVMDVIRYEAEHNLNSLAGLDDEEDLFSPIRKAARRRALWLGINLLTAFAASMVVGSFESAIQEVVALAVLMPIIASMGGIGGSQTLTLMIRAYALNQIAMGSFWALMRKELLVGLINGLLWALVVGSIALLWFDDQALALVAGLALAINQAIASLAGVAVPLAMKRLGIDPALAGSVVLTTITDVVGFTCLLGLGSLILIH